MQQHGAVLQQHGAVLLLGGSTAQRVMVAKHASEACMESYVLEVLLQITAVCRQQHLLATSACLLTCRLAEVELT